ncbi:unnamed protein product, partial [marine sediment metagenome]
MKKFERIFLYSILAILFFYVFLVDDTVESKVAIQEEIRAKSIVIVNDEGRNIIELFANDDGSGMIIINNKAGNPLVGMSGIGNGGSIAIFNKTN